VAVLALREYERIQCGATFDPDNRIVTAVQHRALERFSENYQRLNKIMVFQHGPRQSLVAQNFVGVINLGRDQVEILPKIEGDVSQVRHNLARMISTVLDLDLYDGDASKVDKSNDSILEILIRLFCDRLWQAIRRGMVRRYETRNENLPVLRGRLSVTDQIRQNLARPDRLACVFDEFSENNLLNKVLKAALRVLAKVAQSQANQRNIAELIFCFQDVDDITPATINWELASTNRLSARYKPLLALARLFIEGKSPDVVTGAGEGFALLFDMNELFESYIGVIARRVFGAQGLTVTLQGTKRHLARHQNGNPAFELRPDIVARHDGQTAFIIDTKWKRLKETAYREGITSADVYQMFAYATQYMSPDVVLLFPHHVKLGNWQSKRAEYWLNDVGESGATLRQRISVSTVDLRNLNTVPSQLENIFPAIDRSMNYQPNPIFSNP
jgi:5-methylcytosine-specific restriction enzyme subunit McrC